MAECCCIAEMKEAIEKMNAELIQSHAKIAELAKLREQEECLSAAQNETRKLREENAQLPRDIKEVNETNDDALYIKSLPNEIILKIFSYLTQNQLGRIARVCRRWNVLTKSPLLWKKVNVKIFFLSYRLKSIMVKSFINGLPSCVTSIRFDFTKYRDWTESWDFEELCPRLQEKCPHLEEFILTDAKLLHSLSTVIGLCSQFLQNLKNLVFNRCIFSGYSARKEFCGTSKIEVLDLFSSLGCVTKSLQFSRMLCLKVLCLYNTDADDTWFEDDTSFFNQLHFLNLGYTSITDRTFQAIQRHGLNLRKLYLCLINLQDHDLTFNKSVFPHLETICLCCCDLTCESVVSLMHSCPSLQNIYVDEGVAKSLAEHPFDVANRCKSEIVKVIQPRHDHNVDYSHY